ncbi:ABC transporter ATP-binding protein [Thermococcus henrietii]|uniref:ABC transporter ATP-binding protein n=1 Tax=Thermococcus henrietii TaxID=2016361 RepID=UPI001CB79538|nr:ABC transporter ATP-binding protein [Thermococcus henrietii]
MCKKRGNSRLNRTKRSRKTTLIRQILGLLKPTRGKIEVMGINVSEKPEKIRGIVGYVPQYPLYYPSLTVEEILHYILLMKGIRNKKELEKRLNSVLKLTNLDSARKFYGYQLSGGMMKSLLLSMALIQEPQLLILDEPTSMVDINTKFRIWETIQKNRREGVLLASHDLNEVKKICDRIYVITNGRIVASGTPGEISKLLKTPTEIRLIPQETQDFKHLLEEFSIVYEKRGNIYEMAFEDLESALNAIQHILKTSGIEYLEVDSPSFEKAIMTLIGGKNND